MDLTLEAWKRVEDDELLVSFWGKGLDSFVINCFKKEHLEKRVNIYYSEYLFIGVKYYVYPTYVDIDVTRGDYLNEMNLVFMGVDGQYRARLIVDLRKPTCSLTFCGQEELITQGFVYVV